MISRPRRPQGVADISASFQAQGSPRFTLDTDVLVYSIDPNAGRRQSLAAALIERASARNCVLTLQAINEFFFAGTRKKIADRAAVAAAARRLVDAFPTAAMTESVVRIALIEAETKRSSIWDALLLGTAAEAGCTVVVSEDMTKGPHKLGVKIVRPFDGERLSREVEALLA